MIKSSKKLLTSLGVALALSSAAPLAQAQDLDQLDKELEIMSGVLHTALRHESNVKGIGYRSIEASYLAGQGVLFTINTSSSGWGLNIRLGDLGKVLRELPVAPLPPIIAGGDGDYEFEIAEEWEELAEDALREVENVMREANEQLREVRSREREIAWEQRELERRKRDLEFEMRTADERRGENLKERLKEIEKELAKYKDKKVELEKYATTLEAEQKEQIAKRQEAKQQAYKQFLANFESNVGDALCRFGAGLRELPDNEHVNFVLSDFTQGDDRKKRDRVYVFSKKAVKDCVQEKSNVSDLLSGAKVYEF